MLKDELRDRYPNFKLRMQVAIIESSYHTTLKPGVWLTCRHTKNLDQIVKNINQICYKRGTAIEQAVLFSRTMILFSQTIQGLYFFNGHYSRMQPFHDLYRELAELIPVSQTIQLELGFDSI